MSLLLLQQLLAVLRNLLLIPSLLCLLLLPLLVLILGKLQLLQLLQQVGIHLWLVLWHLLLLLIALHGLIVVREVNLLHHSLREKILIEELKAGFDHEVSVDAYNCKLSLLKHIQKAQLVVCQEKVSWKAT